MENEELLRRMEDLAAQCGKRCEVCASRFLTPAEQAAVRAWSAYGTDCTVVFSGGGAQCERQAAFFLPYYMEADELDVSEHICAVHLKAGFGEPGHRDYLGALMGLGIAREWIGDIRIFGENAYIFCLPSVQSHILSSLDKVGRYGVKSRSIALADVPEPERRVKTVSFTVKSPRLDAAASGMFSMSRTECARLIEAGAVSLNYAECLRCDAIVKPGDVISVRGFGKGTLTRCDGQSRKGRMFAEAEICL